ncbi:MAG: hypothetical protein BWY45_02702 [Euryarchaeota archaeon ADurb.Bin294]|jgi:predicted DNA-binding antitoxin AbrB/MazE fold protein|nr:antitoxin family protein [Methanospirillum sp.]OQA54110.1 MAG: hypothetical protein BWY45_02702 [Euryarchaeota archaeon ADurb.Bin294]
MKSLFILEIVVINMSILAKARYENHVLKPMQDLPLDEGESVIIEIKRSIADQMCGLLATDAKTSDLIIDMEGWD